MDPDDLLLIGHVWRPHGVRGELKIIPETDDPERFGTLSALYVGRDRAQCEAFEITAVRMQPGKKGVTVLVKLASVGTRDAADALRGQEAYALRSELPALDDDEVFLHDLLDLEVETVDGEAVGRVKDVLETQAHPTLLVARPGRPDVMIPAVDAFVKGVDLDAGRIVVAPIEGLLE